MAIGFAGRTTAALAVAVAALSGCGDKQSANATLPEEAAAPTTAADALPPLGPPGLPMPADARTQDGPGAEAFTRYYIDLVNRTSTEMRGDFLREFSSHCAECDRIANDTDTDAAAGYSYQGGTMSITWIAGVARGLHFEMAFTIDQAELAVLDAGGAPVPGLTFEAITQAPSGATLEWDESRTTWLMAGLTLG